MPETTESLADWPTDRLKNEVAKILGNEGYLWMTSAEMMERGFPFDDSARRQLIRSYRELLAAK